MKRICEKHQAPLEESTDECGRCDGFGKTDEDEFERGRCMSCNGSGEITVRWCPDCQEESEE